MSFSEKPYHDQFQKKQIIIIQDSPNQKYQKTSSEIAILSKQSTSNENREQFSDQFRPFNQDDFWITNRYDLEQLNYRLFMNGEFENCLRLQQRLMKMVNRNPEYFHQHSLTYLALNDIDNAEIWYDRATLICQYYDGYIFDYQLVHDLPKQFIDSIQYIQNNIECQKEKGNQLIAECLFAYNVCISQRPQKALKMLMMLIKRYPKCYLPYFYASKCYYHNEDFTYALEFINLAILNFRYKDIQLYNLKGINIYQQAQILLKMGDLEDSIRVYSLFPNNEYFKQQVSKVSYLYSSRFIRDNDLYDKNLIRIVKSKKYQHKSWKKGIGYSKRKAQVIIDTGNIKNLETVFLMLYKNILIMDYFSLCQVLILQVQTAKCYFKLGDFKKAGDHANIASSFYQKKESLKKLLNKIQNEIKRSDSETFNTYQTRQFY